MMDLTASEVRQVKTAFEERVKRLLDMVNVLQRPLAEEAYAAAVDVVNASKKIGVGYNDLPAFSWFWEQREARQRA